MPETNARNDPYMAFRFEVKLDDRSVGGFSSCTGIQLENEVLDYAEGGENSHLHRFPGRSKQTNIVLRRGIVDRELWDWQYALAEGDVQFRNGAILVRDESGSRVVMEWQFRRGFPVKWLGPELNAAQAAVAVETLEIAHQGLERRS